MRFLEHIVLVLHVLRHNTVHSIALEENLPQRYALRFVCFHAEIVLQSASLNILLALASRKDALLSIIHQFPAYLTAVQANDANNRFYVHMGEFVPIVVLWPVSNLGAASSLRRTLPRVQHPGEPGVPRAGRVVSVSADSDPQHAGRAVLLP